MSSLDINPVNIDLLRRLRRQNRLSLLALARIIDRNKSTLWRYEAGELPVPTEVLFRLADLYGVSVDSLRWRNS